MNWMHEGERLHSRTWTQTFHDRSPRLVLHFLTSVPWKPCILLKCGAEITNTPSNEPGQHKCRTSDFQLRLLWLLLPFSAGGSVHRWSFRRFSTSYFIRVQQGAPLWDERHFRQDCGTIFWQGGVVMKGTPSHQLQDGVLSFCFKFFSALLKQPHVRCWSLLFLVLLCRAKSSKLNKVSLPLYLPVKWKNWGCKWTYTYLSV